MSRAVNHVRLGGMERRIDWSLVGMVLIIILLFALLCYGAYRVSHNKQTASQSGSSASYGDTAGVHDTTAEFPGAIAPESANAQCHMRGVLPDPTCTPGVADPAVTQDNLDQTICKSGYSKSVRPSVEYTDNLKRQQMVEYGFTDSIRSHEEDHMISLELGGSPSDPKNLWPEPHASPNAKDKIEDELHAAVCDNRISLEDAQQRIATDWTTAAQGL